MNKKNNILSFGFSVILLASVIFAGCGQKEKILPNSPYSVRGELCSGIFRTQTQGGWGSKPSGNNPGKYLANNFAASFPAGVVIGCKDGNSITLTSAENIKKLLPQGGTPRPLTTSYNNPVDLDNVLVGQVLALTLNVTFDTNDFGFGSSATSLGEQIVVSGMFAGMSVYNVLTEAQNMLGGCGTSAYTASQINEVVSSINENYVNGDTNKGFLACP